MPRAEAAAKAQVWLEKVGLADRLRHRPKTLSGGEQQRVALARAFVTQPDVLFADEPTGSLDEVTGQKIIDLLFSLNQDSGSTLILVTHDMALAKRCQRQMVINAGTVVSA
jgi:putative ABC transport system ATP-binding protein